MVNTPPNAKYVLAKKRAEHLLQRAILGLGVVAKLSLNELQLSRRKKEGIKRIPKKKVQALPQIPQIPQIPPLCLGERKYYAGRSRRTYTRFTND